MFIRRRSDTKGINAEPGWFPDPAVELRNILIKPWEWEPSSSQKPFDTYNLENNDLKAPNP